ncbi:MAG: hypothetical protein HOQ36_13280 [Nocardia sp.]|nr:hypothetical protein [Nocardia sp.]
MAGVDADVLGVERVGADDDLFTLGGNSLVATQAAARLGTALDTTVRALPRMPTGAPDRVDEFRDSGYVAPGRFRGDLDVVGHADPVQRPGPGRVGMSSSKPHHRRRRRSPPQRRGPPRFWSDRAKERSD